METACGPELLFLNGSCWICWTNNLYALFEEISFFFYALALPLHWVLLCLVTMLTLIVKSSGQFSVLISHKFSATVDLYFLRHYFHFAVTIIFYLLDGFSEVSFISIIPTSKFLICQCSYPWPCFTVYTHFFLMLWPCSNPVTFCGKKD